MQLIALKLKSHKIHEIENYVGAKFYNDSYISNIDTNCESLAIAVL